MWVFVYLLSAMEVGDLVCEVWRDHDEGRGMKPPRRPVWRIAEIKGPALVVASLDGLITGLTSSSDLRLANENEIAEARA